MAMLMERPKSWIELNVRLLSYVLAGFLLFLLLIWLSWLTDKVKGRSIPGLPGEAPGGRRVPDPHRPALRLPLPVEREHLLGVHRGRLPGAVLPV